MGHRTWREDTNGWKRQLERGHPFLESRKQRGRRLAKERQDAARADRRNWELIALTHSYAPIKPSSNSNT